MTRRNFVQAAATGAAALAAEAQTPKAPWYRRVVRWDKLMPESMAMYRAGRASFRIAAKPAAEARMWMIEGFAGGIQPWWCHVGAFQEDRRQFRTAEPLMRRYRANEQ